jgi:hypothetical protein
MTGLIRKTALLAVFSLTAACGGDEDNFEPPPGALVEAGELEALIAHALSGLGLEIGMVQPIPHPQDVDGYQSCFETQSAGPCRIQRAPGLSVAFRDEGGLAGRITVQLGVDHLEAGDLLGSAMVSRSLTTTETLRVFVAGTVPPGRVVGGSCDPEAGRDSEDGCAWRERGAPKVGDDALAMSVEVLETDAFSAVAFNRGHVFAEIEVGRQGSRDVPDAVADDIARALDEQIKRALSQ